MGDQHFHSYAAEQYYENSYSPLPEENEDSLEFDINNAGNDDVKTSDEFLIQLIKAYPFLYEKQNKDFKDASMKDNAWTEIGCALGLPALECSNRWLRLRQYYTKERLKLSKQTRTGSGSSKRKKWILYDHMSFLDDHISQRKTFGHFGQSTKHIPSYTQSKVQIEEVPYNASNEDTFVRTDVLEKKGPSTDITEQDSSKESVVQKEYLQTPKSGYLAGRKRKANNDPVESAFLKMNQSFQLVAEKVCSTSTSSASEDEDTLFGKLVAAELRKVSTERKEMLKRKILLDLYS